MGMYRQITDDVMGALDLEGGGLSVSAAQIGRAHV